MTDFHGEGTSTFSRNESSNFYRLRDRVVAVTCAELARFIDAKGRRVDHYEIGDNDVFNLKVLAQVVKIDAAEHHMKYTLDDKTGASITARYLTDDESDSTNISNSVADGMYVHAYGKLHSFAGDVYVELLCPLQPIAHIDQISEHMLKVVFDHFKLLNLSGGEASSVNPVTVAATQTENGYHAKSNGSQTGNVASNVAKAVAGGFVSDDGSAVKSGQQKHSAPNSLTRNQSMRVESPTVVPTPSTPTKSQRVPMPSSLASPSPSPTKVLSHDVLRLPPDDEHTRSMTPDERTLFRYLLKFKDAQPQGCSYHHLLDIAAPKLNLSGPTLMRTVTSLFNRNLIEEKSDEASGHGDTDQPAAKYLCAKI